MIPLSIILLFSVNNELGLYSNLIINEWGVITPTEIIKIGGIEIHISEMDYGKYMYSVSIMGNNWGVASPISKTNTIYDTREEVLSLSYEEVINRITYEISSGASSCYNPTKDEIMLKKFISKFKEITTNGQ